MSSFEMIKYHGQNYPADIPLRIEEIAGHFNITYVKGQLNHSLHTEYSYGKGYLALPLYPTMLELKFRIKY